MDSNPYRVLGPKPPKMLGRSALAAKIRQHLARESARHVSVVGPALYGKSVLLREIVAREEDSIAVYSDLRQAAPQNDDELRQRFIVDLKTALHERRPDLTGLLEMDEVPAEERLQTVRQDLENAGVRALIVLDGFDDVLANAGITRGIWDNLRELAAGNVVRFVTGSRRPLRELCRTEEARTADLWELFHDSPVIVGCFEEDDWDGLLEPLSSRGVTFTAAARASLARWTGGVPPLAIALLQSIHDRVEASGEVDEEQVDEIGAGLVEQRRELMAALWEDCSAEMRTALADLTTRELRASELRDRCARELELRGFVRREGKKLRLDCALMGGFVRGEAIQVDSLQRLFGRDARFEHNVRMLLEMRLAQVPQVDAALHGYVEQAIRHLDPEPRHAVVWMRSIVDRAMDLIWDRELGETRKYPASWSAEWERQGLTRVPDDGHGRLPSERGRQITVLRFATGTSVRGRSVRRVTRHFTRSTALLLEHLLAVGNFGQHQIDGVTRPFAVAACLSAIALCAGMAGDLGIEPAPED